MTQWLVKDLGKLTGVSVQTLHHYDRIGLLKPSLRLSNGYRIYSENDLLKLQQIIALKFFGFPLSEVKDLIDGERNVIAHFNSQVKVLEQKASVLNEAARTLKNIVTSVDSNLSIPWRTIIQMIEVYKMNSDLEHSWVKEIFTPDELRQYAEFEREMNSSNTKELFKKQWQKLLGELKENIEKKPDSQTGIKFGEKYMDFINGIYGRKYAHLRTRKWEKGFGRGKGLDQAGLTPEIMDWLEKALDAYWKDRIMRILDQVGRTPDPVLRTLWYETLDDMFGEETARKDAIYEIVLKEKSIRREAKFWLKSIRNSKK